MGVGSRPVVDVPDCALVAIIGGDRQDRFDSSRLELEGFLVVDATQFDSEERRNLVKLGRRHHVDSIAIVVNNPLLGPLLDREGFHAVHLLESPEFEMRRLPLPQNRKHDTGPFDIIGDVHGCAAELRALLSLLGWRESEAGGWSHPAGRRAVFLGDLVDRGPATLDTLRIVRGMAESGVALCVPGNHDDKLARWLAGRNVEVRHGLAESIASLEPAGDAERAAIRTFIEGLVSHYVLDGGRLVVVHAGLREGLHGRNSPGVRQLCLYGETDGSAGDPPVRLDWAAGYRGAAAVVYGHTPVASPEWRNNTVNIDTGAVYGGRLTALRYPEREFVSVPAARPYALRAGWPAC